VFVKGILVTKPTKKQALIEKTNSTLVLVPVITGPGYSIFLAENRFTIINHRRVTDLSSRYLSRFPGNPGVFLTLSVTLVNPYSAILGVNRGTFQPSVKIKLLCLW
jgi:hypothetical protein